MKHFETPRSGLLHQQPSCICSQQTLENLESILHLTRHLPWPFPTLFMPTLFIRFSLSSHSAAQTRFYHGFGCPNAPKMKLKMKIPAEVCPSCPLHYQFQQCSHLLVKFSTENALFQCFFAHLQLILFMFSWKPGQW